MVRKKNKNKNKILLYSIIGVLVMADLVPKTLIGSQKDQFISFAQLLQTQLNKNAVPVSNQSIKFNKNTNN